MILPNPLFLTGKSVGLAALNATVRPGSLQPWVDELERYVELNGKFSKFSVAYVPFSPPPVFWDYKCRKCLKAGERIVSGRGLLPIENIIPGDIVLSHDGQYHPVLVAGARPFKGEMYSIRPKGGLPFSVTPDHLIFTDRGWQEARELKQSDDLLFPVPLEQKAIDYVAANIGLGLQGYLKVTKELLRLMGYYAAEGHFGQRVISFAFNSEKDQELAEDVRAIVKKLVYEKTRVRLQKQKDRKCLEVIVNSVALGNWLRDQCGHLAPNKRFPHWAMCLPLDVQEELIRAAWYGDGSRYSDEHGYRRYSYTSISVTLANQMRILLLRQGIYSSIRVYCGKGRRKPSFTISVERTDGFNKLSKILREEVEKPKSWFENAVHLDHRYLHSYPWLIEKVPYDGLVHDLQISKSESFVGVGSAMHNCRFWQDPNACEVVASEISPMGWCSIWLPPDDYKALSWPSELLKGDW